ncbi:MAG: TldD/PmbA family protein [Alphaproteobacteria bacterium]|nr:TldD/PmbA family protein [Alphaproteobacteria bacterium]
MSEWHSTLESMIGIAMSLGAEKADAVWFDTTDISLSCRGGVLEGLERSESRAITLRTFVGERQAMVSSTDISLKSLKNLADSAVRMAKVAPPDALSRLASEELYAKAPPALDLCDPVEPAADWLFAQAKEAEDAALSIPGITNSEGADAGYSRSNIGLMIASDGSIRFARDYATSHASLSASVLAGSGTGMQRDYDFTTARHVSDLKAAKMIGENAAHRAIKRLHPRKAKSGTMPVLYDPRTSRQLLSALASAINGSSIVRGSSFLRGDMGKRIFAPGITIIDDPLRKRGLASKPFDGEAVATKKLQVVEDGILASWILDTRSAGALDLATTGHATRGLGSVPSPSSTNLYMEAGAASPEALMKQMGNGLFITETFGTGINTITGDYSQGVSGFLVEHGEIAAPVAEITIAGHLRDMFARMIPADDLRFDYATNAPSLLIDGMAVAGSNA